MFITFNKKSLWLWRLPTSFSPRQRTMLKTRSWKGSQKKMGRRQRRISNLNDGALDKICWPFSFFCFFRLLERIFNSLETSLHHFSVVIWDFLLVMEIMERDFVRNLQYFSTHFYNKVKKYFLIAETKI